MTRMGDKSQMGNPIDPAEASPGTRALLHLGRRAIAAQAEALQALGSSLDDRYAQALALLRHTSGRIVVCGLGKSGLIARKMAATLSATGTPAYYLHAGEAAHGDLGLLVPGDALVLLSNSGETRECGAVLQRAVRLNMPIIAVTSHPDSAVARAANVCLRLPHRAEICPFGTTPTTSTTMMLALGDALAVSLMTLRGVSAADLHQLHPGGRLGLDLIEVDRFMHQGEALPLVGPDTPMPDVLAMIGAKGFGIAGIIDARQRLLGVVTDGDIRRHALKLSTARARDVLTASPHTLATGAMAREALALMAAARITALFVLNHSEGGRVAGLVHVHDLLRMGA